MSFEKFIQDTAREAGDAVLKRFGKDGMHYMKSENLWDVVTKADLLSEKIILQRIKKIYPNHGIISEESGSVNESAKYVWVIDPIDGTLNFSLGVPLWGIMICLIHKKEVVLSVINLPATKEFFFSKTGKGTYLNGKRVRCSRKKGFLLTLGMHDTTLGVRTASFLRNLIQISEGNKMVLGGLGSPANACYVASGQRDWIVSLSGQVWDFAPEYLILKESGCKVTNTKGKAWKFGMLEIVAANPRLHKELLKLTKNV